MLMAARTPDEITLGKREGGKVCTSDSPDTSPPGEAQGTETEPKAGFA